MNTIRITTVAISLLLGSIAFKANAQNTTEKIQKQNKTKPSFSRRYSMANPSLQTTIKRHFTKPQAKKPTM